MSCRATFPGDAILPFVVGLVLLSGIPSIRAQELPGEEPGASEVEAEREIFAFELGLGLNTFPNQGVDGDRYFERLRDFGFADPALGFIRFNLATLFGITRHLSLGIEFGQLESGDTARNGFERPLWGSIDSPAQVLDWSTYGLLALLRGHLWFAPFGEVYAQAGAGLGIASTTFEALSEGPAPVIEEKSEALASYALTGAVGGMLWVHEVAGLFLQVAVSYTPALTNELGETHQTLSISPLIGLRLSTGAPR